MPADGGIRFGQYVLLRRIARGGMAEVFLAQQRGLEGFDRRVAVKRILPHLADSPDFTKMFLGEAKLAAQLTHPNVVHIYDFGKVEGDYFIAMEFVDGVHAGQLFRQGDRDRLPPTLVARIGADAAAALHYAHELRAANGKPYGLVHRDVSPANIMVSYDGIVKLCDFGIAKAAAVGDQLTNPGQVKGKYAYMSPEQTVAHPLDGRSDVFSLAIVLWELLSGKLIVPRGDAVDAMRAIRDGKLEPIERAAPWTPPALAKAITWAMQTKREKRATAMELAQALEAFIKSSPELATPMQLSAWIRPRFPREADQLFGGPATGAVPGTAAAPGTMAAPPTPDPDQPPRGRLPPTIDPDLRTPNPDELARTNDPDERRTKRADAMRTPDPDDLARTNDPDRPMRTPDPDTRETVAVAPATPDPEGDTRLMSSGEFDDLAETRALASSGSTTKKDLKAFREELSRRAADEKTVNDPAGIVKPEAVDQETVMQRQRNLPPLPGPVLSNLPPLGGRPPTAPPPNAIAPSARAVAPTAAMPVSAPNSPTMRGHRAPGTAARLAALPDSGPRAALDPSRPFGRTTPLPPELVAAQKRKRILVVAGALSVIALASFLIALAASGSSKHAALDAGRVAETTSDAAVVAVVHADAAEPSTAPHDAGVAGPTDATAAAAISDAAPMPTALLEIDTVPTGATIRVGDQERVAPARLALREGHYVVTADLAGYEPIRREIDLDRGVQRIVEIPLTKKTARPSAAVGWLNARTTPYSEVYENGKKLDETPFARLELSPGTHVLVFKNPSRAPVTKAVKITAGKTTKLTFDLPP